MNRKQQAIVALHDYATRDGATSNKVISQMKSAGFSLSEIEEAAKEMS